jgi:hypothetical protein
MYGVGGTETCIEQKVSSVIYTRFYKIILPSNLVMFGKCMDLMGLLGVIFSSIDIKEC